MKSSIQSRLEQLVERFEEVSALLSDPATIARQDRFRELSREFAEIEPVVQCFQAWQQSLGDIREAKELAKDGDADMREMAAEELGIAEQKTEELDEELQRLMLPKDPNDGKTCSWKSAQAPAVMRLPFCRGSVSYVQPLRRAQALAD